MKLHAATILFLAALLIGCDRESETTFERLKSETGASDEELEEGIKFCTEFYILMRDDIEGGRVDVKDMFKSLERANEVMATIQREDELSAAMTLATLRNLERGGADRAAAFMVKHLRRFLDSGGRVTKNAKLIREKISEYAKTSAAFQSQGKN